MSLGTEVGVCADLPVIVTIRGNREWPTGKISSICTKRECLDGGDVGAHYAQRILSNGVMDVNCDVILYTFGL